MRSVGLHHRIREPDGKRVILGVIQKILFELVQDDHQVAIEVCSARCQVLSKRRGISG
jgi:hypothetical protein